MGGGGDVEWTGEAETRKADFLAVCEACRAIFWPAPSFKNRTFENFGVSAVKDLYFCVRGTLPREETTRNSQQHLPRRQKQTFDDGDQ